MNNKAKAQNPIVQIPFFIIKRIFDIIVGLGGLIVLGIVTIIVYILHKTSKDDTTIFIEEKRIGKNGKEFIIYKYRTLVDNADAILQEMINNNSAIKKEYEETGKLSNDPRITYTGEKIKQYSIENLPQFLNVLKGDMSIVGNTPYPIEYKDYMGPYYNEIIKTKPGLIGQTLLNESAVLPFENRLNIESYYSNNCNFKIDMQILSKYFKKNKIK